jgi:hypothetical protein
MTKKASQKDAIVPVRSPEIALTDESTKTLVGLARFIWKDSKDPENIVKRAQAKAAARILAAKGKAEEDQIRAQSKARIAEMTWDERRRDNAESVIAEALLALLNSESTDEKASNNNATIDPDFFFRLMDGCQDISDEDMQQIWGKILAGEISKPGSFSYLTLEAVKRLRRREAEMFTTLCRFVCKVSGNLIFFPTVGHTINKDNESFFPYYYIIVLSECGLFQRTGITYATSFRNNVVLLSYFDNDYLIYKLGEYPDLRFTSESPLTQVGEELLRIAGASPDPNYEIALSKTFDGWTGFRMEGPFPRQVRPK